MDAVTGRLNGAVGWTYQCHIRGSAGKDGLMSVGLGTTISPGGSTVLPLSPSVTTALRLSSQLHHPPE